MAEFIVEFMVAYEDARRVPGTWKEMLRVPGNHASAALQLHGDVEYRFRVSAVNKIGYSEPSDVPGKHTPKEILSKFI